MAITEESRFELHQRLREVLGDEPGTTLMEHLPPADFATKRDVVAVKDDVLAEVAAVRTDVAAVREDLAAVRRDVERVADGLTHTREVLSQRMDRFATSEQLEKYRGELHRLLYAHLVGVALLVCAILGVVEAL